RVEEQLQEISETANSLRGLIGTVLAMTLIEDWSPTELSIHFTGVTSVLTETRSDLIKTLRKELKRVEDEIARTDASDVAWAVAWRNRRASYLNSERKLG